jgi:hypothetical protein
MAGRKKESFDRGRVEFKADPEWVARLNRQAVRIGLNLSSLIRMVMTRWLDEAEAQEPPRRKGGGQ